MTYNEQEQLKNSSLAERTAWMYERKCEGDSVIEIASSLGIDESTVRVRIKRALKYGLPGAAGKKMRNCLGLSKDEWEKRDSISDEEFWGVYGAADD